MKTTVEVPAKDVDFFIDEAMASVNTLEKKDCRTLHTRGDYTTLEFNVKSNADETVLQDMCEFMFF